MTGPRPTPTLIKPGLFTADDPADPDLALKGSRCDACAETFFPPRAICPRCHSPAAVRDVALSRTGVVYACTRVVRTPAQYPAPYLLAWVDLPEGVRLMTQLACPAGADVRVGAPVHMVVEPLFDTADGRAVWGYRFRPEEAR